MSTVALTVDGNLADVALDRPGKHNGLTIEMMRELTRVARFIESRKDIRAVILRGNGPSFSSGLDIAGTMSNPLGVARNFVPNPLRGTNSYQEACWAWRRLPQPVIASVHGHCYGGALQLALAADFRFATPDSDFSVMEVKHGLIPDMTGAATLSRLVGLDKALLLTMTADRIDAAHAARIGLITEISDDPIESARQLAERIAERSPHAVAAAKRLFDRTWHVSARRAFGIERATQLPLILRRARFRR